MDSLHKKVCKKYILVTAEALSEVVGTEISNELRDAIYEWTENEDAKPLERVYKTQPEEFKTLNVGTRYKTLYRILALTNKDWKVLRDKGVLENPGVFESWSTSLKGLQEFSDGTIQRNGHGYENIVVLKRDVPMTDRVLCLPCLGYSYYKHAHEREILVKRLPVLLKNVLYVLEPGVSVVKPKDARWWKK